MNMAIIPARVAWAPRDIPARHEKPRQHPGGEQRRGNAHGDGHGKALHRAGAEDEQHYVGEEGCRVGIEDRVVGASETVLERRKRRAAEALFLADAFVDQDVGVHRHAERQQNARHARQGQRRLEQAT